MRRAHERSKKVWTGSQQGFTLIETLVVLGLSMVIMAAGTGYMVRHTEGLANDVAADQLKSVAGAAQDYAREHKDAILTTLDGSPTASVSVAMLKAQGYLPPSMAETNNFGQLYAVRFTKSPEDELEGLVVTQGGQAIKDLNKRKIAQAIGAAGGFLDENTMTTLTGSYGAWERSLTDFGLDPGEAELAYALFVESAVNRGANLSDHYLSRREVPGMPQLNQMQANLDMDGNDITSVGHLQAQSAWVSSLEVEALTTGTLSVTGESLFTGRTVFQNTGGRGPVVERLNSTGNASIEYRTTGGALFAGAATPTTFAVGGDANINSPANRWFEVGPSGARVGGADVWTTATFDPDSKAEAQHEHSASEVSSGVFATARIPNLDASKINSGVLTAARIPSLDAGKVTTGTFNLARIPALPISKTSGLQSALDSKSAVGHAHSASEIVSGTLSADLIPTLPISRTIGLQAALDGKAAASHNHDASNITSGTLNAARIPSLNASKITAGTFHVNRIPALPISQVTDLQAALDGKAASSHTHAAGDITSGVLNAARIPNLNASKITAGAFHVDRIPTLLISKVNGLQTALDSKANVSHTHSADDITSGTLHLNRIPALPISKVTNLQATLDGKAAASHNHDASNITSGTLNAARIPSLNASKITAGTFHVNRIPALPISQVTDLQAALDGKAASSHTHAAGDITSGVLNAARIPNLNASKITAGAFHVDRIPTLPISKVNGLQTALDSKANVSHTHSADDITSGTLHLNRIPALPISKVTNLQATLDGKASLSHVHTAADITSGVLNAARIPDLNASKITAGTLHVNRIPDLSAAKITSGTLSANRIPNLNASKITAGTFHVDRIPAMPISKVSGLQAALDGKVNKSGDTMTGALNINAGNRPLSLYAQGSGHAYMQWYVESSASTRSAYLGYGSASSTAFTISNDRSGGNIVLSPGSGGSVMVGNSAVWHAGNFNPNSKANTSHTHSAADITSGTFNAARIPNLDASKITAGTFNAGRIPNLNASKITAGAFHADRIPNLNASKITAGTLNANRIPSLPQSKITGLTDALDNKLNLSGGTLTGTLTATRFRPTQTASCNASCSGNGWVARTTNGALLSCDNGQWRGYSCGSGGGGTQPPQGGCPGQIQPPGCEPGWPSGWICLGGERRECI